MINLPPKAWIKKMHSLLQDRHGLKDAQSLMQDIATITKKSDSDPKNTDALAVLSIGPGLPPVPNKLVARIQVGTSIMAELLLDHLGISTNPRKRWQAGNKAKAQVGHKHTYWSGSNASVFTCYVAVLA